MPKLIRAPFQGLPSLLLLAGSVSAQELLVNGGFESGDLSGWAELAGAGEGHVVSVSGPGEMPCVRIDPSTPRTGGFLFSASVPDGALRGTPEITLEQSMDISAAAPGSTVAVAGFVAGAPGCGPSSDDVVTLILEIYSGATLQSSASAGPLDPVPGAWHLLSIPAMSIPAGADTVVLRVVTDLDPGFASIDIGVDDLSVTLHQPANIPAMSPVMLVSLALLMAALGTLHVHRRIVATPRGSSGTPDGH